MQSCLKFKDILVSGTYCNLVCKAFIISGDVQGENVLSLTFGAQGEYAWEAEKKSNAWEAEKKSNTWEGI